MFEIQDKESVILKTSKGYFIITETGCLEGGEEGFIIDYQEVGKPICCLAEIVHDTEEDELRTNVWPNCVAKSYSDAYTFIHERPHSKELNELVEAIKKFNITHEGIDLEIQFLSDQSSYTYELGYANPKTSDFVPLQKFKFFDVVPREVEECAQFYNWTYTEL